MKWILVVLMPLLVSTNAVGQHEIRIRPDEAKGNRDAITHYLNSLSTLDAECEPSHELVKLLFWSINFQESQKKQGNPEQCELIDYVYMQPLLEAFKRDAYSRIPSSASNSQREKLQSAALIDIHRKIVALRESPVDDYRQPRFGEGGYDIFGFGSLFEKVLRTEKLSNR